VAFAETAFGRVHTIGTITVGKCIGEGRAQCLPVSFSDLAAAADPSVVQVRTRQEMPPVQGGDG